MMALLYLTKLLLHGGPAVVVLPSLAGYTAEPYETLPPNIARPCVPHKIGIRLSDETLQAAVEILESVESTLNSSPTTENVLELSKPVSPIWYPLALFHGALVLWARLEEERTERPRRPNNHQISTSRRFLQGFHTALKAIEGDWDCAGHMAETVKALI
jgi:hypothetical protein